MKFIYVICFLINCGVAGITEIGKHIDPVHMWEVTVLLVPKERYEELKKIADDLYASRIEAMTGRKDG